MTEQERFEREVNRALLNIGQRDDTNVVKVCETPQLLVDYGICKLPIVYGKSHLRDAIKEKDRDKHFHGLMLEQIYKLPNLIALPAMILRNNNEHDKGMPILILNDVDKDRLPLFVILETNAKRFYDFKLIDTNAILSLYGRNNFNRYFEKVIENNGLIFYDKKMVQSLDQLCGTQLFNKCSSFEPNKILQYKDEKVKADIKNIKELSDIEWADEVIKKHQIDSNQKEEDVKEKGLSSSEYERD